MSVCLRLCACVCVLVCICLEVCEWRLTNNGVCVCVCVCVCVLCVFGVYVCVHVWTFVSRRELMIVCFWVKVLSILFFFSACRFCFVFFFIICLHSSLYSVYSVFLFFHIDGFLSVLQVGHSASGYLALSRSVLQLSRWFHFIAQKQNKTMGSPRHSPIHTHLVWEKKKHQKGIVTGKK